MKLRTEKINHIAHLVANFIAEKEEIAILKDKNEMRIRIKEIILNELKIDDEIDRETRKKLLSYSKKMTEGSREWDILYQKTFEEELAKRRQEK